VREDIYFKKYRLEKFKFGSYLDPSKQGDIPMQILLSFCKFVLINQARNFE